MEVETELKNLLTETDDESVSDTLEETVSHIPIDSTTVVKAVDSSSLPFWKRALFLFIISITLGVSIHCTNILLPFYPIYSEDVKSVSPRIVGAVFGTLSFLVFFFSIIFGMFIDLFGPKFLYFSGNLVVTGTLFLFGFIDKMSPFWFDLYSFLFIVNFSYGLAAVSISSYSICMFLFPRNHNTVLALIDSISGVGFITGPIVGGLLYGNTSWLSTFSINTAIMLLCTVASLLLLFFLKLDSVQGESLTNYLNIFRLLPNPNIIAVIIVNIVLTLSWSYQYTSLGPFLERTYNSSTSTIGYALSTPNISYILLLPIIGVISERFGSRFFIWISIPIQICALILTPPLYYIFLDRAFVTRESVNINASLIPVHENNVHNNYIFVTFIGQVLVGTGYTLAYGPMYVDMKQHISEELRTKLVNLPEILSSIRMATFFLANGLGPMSSGFIESGLSFDDETFIFILILMATFVFFTILSFANFMFKRRKSYFKIFYGNQSQLI